MPKLTIDGQEIEVEAGSTVFQACEQAGIEIPHFCYHQRLNIAGNCRMCLVEVEKSPKLVASCAMPVGEGMVVHTQSEKVQKGRHGVMEFLLANHPLDCPICDQGGECDLQDQAMAYGRDCSRYDENKRAVPEKNMGPLIKTFMNRCIHCTRCVRFATEVAGVPELGAIHRGEHMEITTYLNQAFNSEMSGNIVDLCPVGALTSKPYSYKGRPWELTKTESIDVLDAVGSNIRVDTYGPTVKRILPRLNEDVNEEWISDKTRHACDGLSKQRLDQPYIRVRNKLQPATWEEAFNLIAKKLNGINPKAVGAIAGDLADVESMYALKKLMGAIGTGNIDCCQDGAFYSTAQREHYLFNTSIAGIDDADMCLLIGAHPRYDASVLSARMYKRWRQGGFNVYRIGSSPEVGRDLPYPVTELGSDASILLDILSGAHKFASIIKSAKKPMLVIGQQALTRRDSSAIVSACTELVQKYPNLEFNILHKSASRVGGLDIGFVPGRGHLDVASMPGKVEVLYLLGADEIDMSAYKGSFIIYQGHHGDAGAHAADVILPGAAYTEKSATYVNLEGRVQRTTMAVSPPGDAKEDWKIIRALAERLGVALDFDTLDELRAKLCAEYPTFSELNVVSNRKPFSAIKAANKINKSVMGGWDGNYYMSDVISRNSVTMAKCASEFGFDKRGQRNVA